MSLCRSREHAGQKPVQTLQKRIFQMQIMMHVFLFGQVPGLCPFKSPVKAQTDDNPPDLDNPLILTTYLTCPIVLQMVL